MLYITGETSKTWPAVARILSKMDQVEMVALLYPSQPTLPPKFFRSNSVEGLEPVTTWGEGELPTASARLSVSPELLDVLASLPADLGDWDFALYPACDQTWVACAIPHEELVLVRNDNYLKLLQEAGLPVSTSAPDWW